MTGAVATSGYILARRWLRFEVDVPIRVIICLPTRTRIFDARGISLSEGGMALFAGAELTAGDLVAVEFTPAYSAPPIRVDAIIRNRKNYHYGVEFLIATDIQKQTVETLRRHLPALVKTE